MGIFDIYHISEFSSDALAWQTYSSFFSLWMKFLRKFSSNWDISFFLSMFTAFTPSLFLLSLSVRGIFLFTNSTSFYIEIGFGLHFINYVDANLLFPVGIGRLRGRWFRRRRR